MYFHHIGHGAFKDYRVALLGKTGNFCITRNTVYQHMADGTSGNRLCNTPGIPVNIHVLDLDRQILTKIKIPQRIHGAIALIELFNTGIIHIRKIQSDSIIVIAIHGIGDAFKYQLIRGCLILPQLEQTVSRPTEGNTAIAIALFQIRNLHSVKADGIILTVGQNIHKLIHLVDTQTAYIPGIQIALCALTVDIETHNFRNFILGFKEIGVCFSSAQGSFAGIIAAI